MSCETDETRTLVSSTFSRSTRTFSPMPLIDSVWSAMALRMAAV